MGDQFQVNAYTLDLQADPVVSAQGADGFVVVWESKTSPGSDDYWGIVARRHVGGVPVGYDFQVNTYVDDLQVEPAAGVDGSGGFVVTWRSYGSLGNDNSRSSVQARRFDGTGFPLSGEFQVNTYTTDEQLYPSVGPAADGFVVVWTSRRSAETDTLWSVQAQRYAADGSPSGGQFQVNTFTPQFQGRAAVGPIAGGGFVVAWESELLPGKGGDDGILAQRYSADGVPLGGEFQVNSYTTGNQVTPAVGVAGAGFVIVWTSDGSYGTDTDQSSIQAQLFAEDGSPVGGEFQVNTYTPDRQFQPVVGASGGDGFVVAWRSEGSNGSDRIGWSVQAQRYTTDGAPVDGQFQVNTYITQTQAHPGIAPDGTGGFVVVWWSDGSYGTDTSQWSIQAQRYGVTVFEDGFESGDTSAWSNAVP